MKSLPTAPRSLSVLSKIMANDEKFTTHIKEPRWQQVVSILIVLGVVLVELWLFFRH